MEYNSRSGAFRITLRIQTMSPNTTAVEKPRSHIQVKSRNGMIFPAGQPFRCKVSASAFLEKTNNPGKYTPVFPASTTKATKAGTPDSASERNSPRHRRASYFRQYRARESLPETSDRSQLPAERKPAESPVSQSLSFSRSCSQLRLPQSHVRGLGIIILHRPGICKRNKGRSVRSLFRGQKNGGVDRNRTGLSDFADRCLTSWLPRLVMRVYYNRTFRKSKSFSRFFSK